VIVGGSLVGQCAALALSRDGWNVIVLERSPGELTGGTGIGIDRQLLASVTGIDADNLPIINVGFAATAWGLVRGALNSELQHHPRVTVRAGNRVVDVRVNEIRRDVVVQTTEGEFRADLVLGADGYSSIVRRFVSPDQPDAAYSGYLLWRGLVDERQIPRGFTDHEIYFTEHVTTLSRLVTFGVPGSDGDARPGHRRGSFTWFDTGHTQLLRISGKLEGEIVKGTLTGDNTPDHTIAELQHLAQRWPTPWSRAINRSLDRRDFIGTPISEYLPPRLVRGPVALVGDAAHVVSPITGAGFHHGLLDVQALTTALRTKADQSVNDSLSHYQQRRLGPARRLATQSQHWSRAYVSLSARRLLRPEVSWHSA
jgi:2-polyprenyl-6-methoxyphenol hydroxylase-like FAD-dependent oxidoreductase